MTAPQHFETRRLSIEPRNIEALTELRDYKSQVPEKLIALKKVIEEAMRNYAVCDELCYKLPDADFTLRWDLYSWPKKITDECVELEEKCIRLENKQQIEMEEAQAEVRESVLKLNFLLKQCRSHAVRGDPQVLPERGRRAEPVPRPQTCGFHRAQGRDHKTEFGQGG